MSAAQNVSGNVTITLRMVQSQSSGVVGPTAGGGSASLTNLISIVDSLVNGTGASKDVDQLYASQLALTASTPVTIHFENASAHDPFGNTLAMLRIRLLAVQVVDATSGHDVKVESSASNGIAWIPSSAAPLIARANFGAIIIYDPNSTGGGVGNIVGSTTDGLTLDPGTNAISAVNVVVVGDSVA